MVLGAFKRLRTLATISFFNSFGHLKSPSAVACGGGDDDENGAGVNGWGGDTPRVGGGFAAGGDLESTNAGGDDDDDGGGRSGHGRFVGFEGEGGDGELSAVTVGIITKANNSDNFNRAWKLPILIWYCLVLLQLFLLCLLKTWNEKGYL